MQICINNELLAIYKSICFYLLTHSTAAGMSESPSTAIGESVFAAWEATLAVTSILEDVHGRLGFETPTFSLGPSASSLFWLAWCELYSTAGSGFEYVEVAALFVFLCFPPCLHLKRRSEIVFFRT